MKTKTFTTQVRRKLQTCAAAILFSVVALNSQAQGKSHDIPQLKTQAAEAQLKIDRVDEKIARIDQRIAVIDSTEASAVSAMFNQREQLVQEKAQLEAYLYSTTSLIHQYDTSYPIQGAPRTIKKLSKTEFELLTPEQQAVILADPAHYLVEEN